MRRLSAVVDTNLFISALILPHSKPSRLITLWKQNKFTLITSDLLLRELKEVLARPKYEEIYDISPRKQQALITQIQQHARIVKNLTKPIIAIRDPKDLIVLATAIDGNADFLVTGDKDLLVLKNFPDIEPLKVITADEFLKLLSGD
ncbi:putative toxin-antitoxin system toxin component, PIN family [Candidatus Gottesmanbacteria bacterium RIFCSPLOWO2_01_FULL_48_11]|uniref:PIN domain-containing protein n=3 Tax=Candidatus Gottesmaniibacteriota TaxID=1752720 RepID=A0A0G1UNY3_9BACT|nr:MAG: hypothetical protein UY16_C0017G0006 [Candidatus Gottesmanbacteria bacterium GW2011_GWA2_47_9]KKU95849.1 MAG: hypothetical protein UY27_C0007G0017 [Candidatus Gottesmanbacteria bacterium GW2011_GWA1_48_13]OGG28385.1 MAG: putative toxin-antitoxin system toxin component, PIN family [Candidatus Gottesmanbacteria bacterium RIFCSPLOWO2_01_FULL_48_11]